jgi:hypothetical protein
MSTEMSAAGTDGSIEDVAAGQRMIIFAILLNIVAAILSVTVAESLIWLGAGATVLAILGLVRLSDGLGYSGGTKILLIILSFFPLIALVMLLVINDKATKALRAAGYKVGLFGARKP